MPKINAVPAASTLVVGTYNVHNIYDAVDDPKYNDDVLTPDVYAFRLAKAAAAITAMGMPDVLGLEEVENQTVVDDLLKQPAFAKSGYKAVFIQGNDMWQHNDAIFYKEDRVTLDKLDVVNDHWPNDGGVMIDPNLLFSTPPAIADFSLKQPAGVRDAKLGFTMILNHMKSKIGGPQHDARRLAQGNFIGGLVDARVTKDPARMVLVTGDLNAGLGDAQFGALMTRADGTTRMVDSADHIADAKSRYSYTYKGRNDLLDHVLVSAGSAGQVQDAKIFHFNTRPQRDKVEDPASPDGASDHDPVLATLKFGAPVKAMPALVRTR